MEKFDIFDHYQKKALLPSLGSSDEIYNKLKGASDDIAEHLKINTSRIIPFTLVALDNMVPESEPILEEVETKISAHWQMLRSHFEKMPIALYRAIILESLSKLAATNLKHASSIWFTSVDVYPLLNIPVKEQVVLKEFLDKLSDYVEESAIKDWKVDNVNSEVKIPKFELKLAKTITEVDLEQLTDEMIASAGPSGQDGVARESPNPYWPNQNANWSYQFAPRAASGIASVINEALKKQTVNLNKNIESVQSELNSYFIELEKSMSTAIADASKSSIAVEQRSKLLWWKETLYSKKFRKSYRKMDAFKSSIAMAYDLYYLLPSLFPVSVDYILRETFEQVHGPDKKDIKLIDYLKEVAKTENFEFLSEMFKNNLEAGSRTNLTSFLTKIVHSKVDIKKDLLLSIGIKPDVIVSYQDMSLWILHSLSAEHLLSSK